MYPVLFEFIGVFLMTECVDNVFKGNITNAILFLMSSACAAVMLCRHKDNETS